MENWIGVAAANHVARGRSAGFMQVNHGKAAPLRRIAPGDIVSHYSPVEVYGTRTLLQAFTALGRVRAGEPYLAEMGAGLTAFRRDVDWFDAQAATIAPLLDRLELTADKPNWGYPFRFGLLAISDADMGVIAAAMGCTLGLRQDKARQAGSAPQSPSLATGIVADGTAIRL